MPLCLCVCVYAKKNIEGVKIEFRAFSSRRSSLTQTIVKSCVDFEVIHTHGLEIAIQEHPTLNTNLNIPSEECSYTSEIPSESVVLQYT